MRVRAAPETFYITDHYLNYPWMLVRLATIDPDDLRDLLEESWRLGTPPKRSLSAPDQKDKTTQPRSVAASRAAGNKIGPVGGRHDCM